MCLLRPRMPKNDIGVLGALSILPRPASTYLTNSPLISQIQGTSTKQRNEGTTKEQTLYKNQRLIAQVLSQNSMALDIAIKVE